MVECKSTQYKSITIERDGSKGMIKRSQYDSMKNAEGSSEMAGFLIQFQTGTEEQRTYYWSIKNFFDFLTCCDKKSCNELDVIQYGGIAVEQNKIRVNYKYNIAGLFNKLIKQKEENYGKGETSI